MKRDIYIVDPKHVKRQAQIEAAAVKRSKAKESEALAGIARIQALQQKRR